MKGTSEMKLMSLCLGLVVLATGGCVSVPVCRLEDGKPVVSSLFDLEIGSSEYAQVFAGQLRESPVITRRQGKAETNRTYSVAARLADTSLGFDEVYLRFDDEKRLTTCRLWSEHPHRLTLDECRKRVDVLAKKLESGFGIEVSGRDDDEDDVRRRLDKCVEDMKKEGRWRDGVPELCGVGCCSRSGHFELDGHGVRVSVDGTMWNTGKCDVSVSVDGVHYDEECEPSADYVRVYTNSMASARLTLPLTEEQKKAHDEAAPVRAALVRLCGIDLDKPEQRVDVSKIDLKAEAKPEWTKLDASVAGMTERRVNMQLSFGPIPFGTCVLRHVFEGDATTSECEAVAKEFLSFLEKEIGTKVPTVENKNPVDRAAIFGGSGVPSFGDGRAALRTDTVKHFNGRIGDLSISIESAPPRYVRKNGKYEVSVRGAVLVNFFQAPFFSPQPKE